MDCNAADNYNAGCGVKANTDVSYGPAFNGIGGGWFVVCLFYNIGVLTRVLRYAVERTNSFINVWFWARNDITVPPEVAYGGFTVDTDVWVSNRHALICWPFSFFISLTGNTFCFFPKHSKL